MPAVSKKTSSPAPSGGNLLPVAPADSGGFEPDLDAALARVLKLMSIPARSGEEREVAEYIAAQLHDAGFPKDTISYDRAHVRSTLKGNVGNLICRLPGTYKAPRRMLMAHMDTVPICVGAKPIVDGQFVRSADPNTGLGADDRAGCAAVLTAAMEIGQRRLPHPPTTFLWTVQEEVGLHGARHAELKLLGGPKLAFNWDGGSSDKLVVGATGGYRMEIVVRGIPSHAGVAPEAGVSAIALASLAIADLTRGGWHGLVVKGKHRGTSNVGVIHGGEATNVVTERVTLRVEARSHEPAFRERIVKEIERAFQRAAKELKSSTGQRGSVEFSGQLDYEAFRLTESEPALLEAIDTLQSVGLEPKLSISNGGLDANWLNARGIPTVTLGCGQMNIHTTGERLDIAHFQTACRVALRLATGF